MRAGGRLRYRQTTQEVGAQAQPGNFLIYAFQHKSGNNQLLRLQIYSQEGRSSSGLKGKFEKEKKKNGIKKQTNKIKQCSQAYCSLIRKAALDSRTEQSVCPSPDSSSSPQKRRPAPQTSTPRNVWIWLFLRLLFQWDLGHLCVSYRQQNSMNPRFLHFHLWTTLCHPTYTPRYNSSGLPKALSMPALPLEAGCGWETPLSV